MSCTAASHHGAIELFWLHFSGALIVWLADCYKYMLDPHQTSVRSLPGIQSANKSTPD